jgi:N,N'-diacetyllegionaminate synthase
MTYIIAEAGVNHNGSLDLALELVNIAAKSGANAIKFQTFKSEKLSSKNAKKAKYQKKNLNTNNNSQLEMLKKLELSYDDFRLIFNKCKEKNIDFISTPFDLDSVDFLEELGVDIYKISSGDLTNYLLLKKVAEKGKKIILSTGMGSMDEVIDSVNFIKKNGCINIVVLHCVSCYPTAHKDLNLKCIKTMKEKLNLETGFSDHTEDYKASIYSVLLGAKYIEKHFTIDKNMKGPDHKASLNPEELNIFVSLIRECEIIMGDGVKLCKDSELNTKSVIRRSLFFNRDMKEGEIIEEKDLIALRPYDGICASKFENYIGKKLLKDVSKYTKLSNNLIELDM